MTLKEIAKLAGVSASTVSRVLNTPDNSFGTEEVRSRIWKIVNETHYIPNSSAQVLRNSKRSTKSNVSAKTIVCIFGRAHSLEDVPIFNRMILSVKHYALQYGYNVIGAYSAFDITDKAIEIQLFNQTVDGVIVMGRISDKTEALIAKNFSNIIYVGLNNCDLKCDQVIVDGFETGKLVMEHLLGLGHRTIGYLGETKKEVRFAAYRKSLQHAGLNFDPSLVFNCNVTGSSGYTGGYNGIEALLEQSAAKPTAIFCTNDPTAIGAIKKLAEMSIRVPEDISIIGMDNTDMGQFISPMLTTIEFPQVEMGEAVVMLLISRIEKKHKIQTKIVLPPRLVIRESTAVPKT